MEPRLDLAETSAAVLGDVPHYGDHFLALEKRVGAEGRATLTGSDLYDLRAAVRALLTAADAK